jgi:hypothetical protein
LVGAIDDYATTTETQRYKVVGHGITNTLVNVEKVRFGGAQGTSYDIDTDGDGRDDIVWRNDDGAVSLWRSAAAGGFIQGAYNAQVSTDWSVAQVGDFNGDGKDDLLWRNSGGAVSIWQSNGNGFDQNTLYDPGASTAWQIQAHDFLI